MSSPLSAGSTTNCGAASRAAVLGLRDEPGYPELLERLAAARAATWAVTPQLEIDPADAGGVRGDERAAGRSTTPCVTLADRCVDDLGPELRRLWT